MPCRLSPDLITPAALPVGSLTNVSPSLANKTLAPLPSSSVSLAPSCLFSRSFAARNPTATGCTVSPVATPATSCPAGTTPLVSATLTPAAAMSVSGCPTTGTLVPPVSEIVCLAFCSP